MLRVTKQAVHQPLATLEAKSLVARAVDPDNTLRPALEARLAGVERAFRAAGTADASWRDVMKRLAE